jgi:hypothetical protein
MKQSQAENAKNMMDFSQCATTLRDTAPAAFHPCVNNYRLMICGREICLLRAAFRTHWQAQRPIHAIHNRSMAAIAPVHFEEMEKAVPTYADGRLPSCSQQLDVQAIMKKLRINIRAR